eukprot:scaffold26070_cov71-Cyclotella_meneghiniana.AAC.2
MTDFFARIFAVPSEYDDDDSYSADDTYSQSSSIRRRSRIKNAKQSYQRANTFTSYSDNISDDENTKEGIGESSASVSYDDDTIDHHEDHRGRQRRNDAPSGHRSASEPRSKQKKKRSSSERPNATSHTAAKQSQQSRYRSARSLSKVPERHHAAPSSSSPNNDVDKKEMKNWRSKFSKGIKKKHISFTSDSSPALTSSKQAKKPSPKNSESRKQHHHAKANDKTPASSQPINVGDFITISQQYLEKNEEMSVLTLPKELASKEVDEENLMQIIGQRGVLGNDAVQAFLDRRNDGRQGGGGENLHIHRSASVESKGVYERVGKYATKLLDISRSQSLENSSTLQEEGVEIPHNQDLLAVANHQIGKHAWPCDPGYSVGDNAAHTVITEQEIGSIGMPPPASPSPFDGIEEEHRVRYDVQIPVRDDPSGIHIDTSITVDRQKSTESRRQFDEVHSRPIESQAPVNKSVSFSLPPPSSLPPAPPFLGPHLDYYYSMERDAKDKAPIWSHTTILPPIIELWSAVEDSSKHGAFGSFWNAEKEKELVGEEEVRQIASEQYVSQSEKALLVGVRTRGEADASKKPAANPTSPGEKSMEYFHDILDCNDVDLKGVIDCNNNDDDDDDAPADEKEGLKLTTSSLSIKTETAGSSETEEVLGDDANFRHRSQWKSSHNMTYKPPLFNGGVGRSESSEDSVIKLRRFHEDGILTAERQDSQGDTRPVILPCRVGRPLTTLNPSKCTSITLTHSPSAASYESSSSYNAKIFAAIVIQASARSVIERQQFVGMRDSVLIIQSALRRFLYRQRYLLQLKLKRSYYPCNWKNKLLK